MKTIALRFGEQFSPECGTISAHQEIIDQLGFVWYGKLGTPVSKEIIDKLIHNEGSKILLIRSGRSKRFWAYISDVKRETPPLNEIPSYYREQAKNFKTWFKVTRFEQAPKDVMSKCWVISSGNTLSEVSKHSMSPYFIIEV